jgi:hypothetical protein
MIDFGFKFGFWSILFDGAFTSAVVWLIHTFQEMGERAFQDEN